MTTLQEQNLKMLQQMFPNQIRISVPQYSKVVADSRATTYRKIAEGIDIPDYQKGSRNNSKIYFNLVDVAFFLSKTIKTA